MNQAQRRKAYRARVSKMAAETDAVVAPEGSPAVAEQGDKIKAELDGLLDDIDTVLEKNAEDFVKGYIQRGGQ